MSWASRRQTTYLGGLIIFLGVILFLIIYPILRTSPTCFDKKQNGDEQGVDCGGSCSLMCESQSSNPIVLWSRAFPVSNNVYNLFAYIENQNKNSAVRNVSYEFRIYDTNNLLIGRRQGSTFIPPNSRFAVFESRFDAGQATPKSVTFEFTSPLVWIKQDPSLQTMPIHIDKVVLGDDPKSPSLSAQITNDSIYKLPQFDVITILYDNDQNAISVSKTHKDGLNSNSSTPLFFTWPTAFPKTPAVENVFYQINPFEIQL